MFVDFVESNHAASLAGNDGAYIGAGAGLRRWLSAFAISPLWPMLNHSGPSTMNRMSIPSTPSETPFLPRMDVARAAGSLRRTRTVQRTTGSDHLDAAR